MYANPPLPPLPILLGAFSAHPDPPLPYVGVGVGVGEGADTEIHREPPLSILLELIFRGGEGVPPPPLKALLETSPQPDPPLCVTLCLDPLLLRSILKDLLNSKKAAMITRETPKSHSFGALFSKFSSRGSAPHPAGLPPWTHPGPLPERSSP